MLCVLEMIYNMENYQEKFEKLYKAVEWRNKDYKRELDKSKKCDEIAIKYNSLIDVVNNFLRVQQDAEKAKE